MASFRQRARQTLRWAMVGLVAESMNWYATEQSHQALVELTELARSGRTDGDRSAWRTRAAAASAADRRVQREAERGIAELEHFLAQQARHQPPTQGARTG